MSLLKQILTPPVFEDDEDKTLVAASLHILLLAGTVVATVAFVVFWVVAPASLPRVLVTDLPIVLILLTSWVLVQRGHVRWAARLVVAVAWLATTLSSVLAGGPKASLFGIGSMLVLILGGFLLGRWGAFSLVLLNILTGVAIVWADTRGWIPPVPSSVSPVSILTSYTLNMLAAAAVIYVALNTTQKVLMSARTEITERKHTKAAFRKSEMQMRLLWESSSDGMRLTDAQGKMVMVNETFCRIVGKPKSALEGQSLETIYVTHVHEQTLQDYRERFAARTIPSYFEGQLKLWNGQRPWYGVATSFFEVEGQPPLLLCLFRDITERKQAEQQLQQRLSELAAVNEIGRGLTAQLELEATLKFVADKLLQILDIQGLYIALHDAGANLLHFLHWQTPGHTGPVDSVPPGGLTRAIIQTRQPLLINQNYEQHFAELGGTRLLATGRVYPQAWLGVPMYARNEFIGIISIHNYQRENAFTEADVRLLTTIAANVGIAIQNAQLYTATQQELAERKRIQLEREQLIAELEAKNAELERFTYTVSHDLKAPLITIRGFLGFVEKDALAGNVERLKADMARITEATDKMQQLLTELLELSRIGRMMNPPQAVPFETIVREALELVRGRIEARGVQVRVAPDLPVVYGDRARLVEVVQNLVDNAAKFIGSQSKPFIEIGQRGADADGKPILFVSDNGIGIESQYHERVFGLFNKLDAQSDGTGVGLALVKRIVEFHGGRIWVESKGKDEGATFYFTLPVIKLDG